MILSNLSLQSKDSNLTYRVRKTGISHKFCHCFWRFGNAKTRKTRQKYFDGLCSGISERPKRHFRCCATRRLTFDLVSQVIPSHRAQSHDFSDAHGGIYSVNVFKLSMCIFSYQIKSVSYSIVRISILCRFFFIYAHLGASIQHLFYATF